MLSVAVLLLAWHRWGKPGGQAATRPSWTVVDELQKACDSIAHRRERHASACRGSLMLIHHAKECLAIRNGLTNGWTAPDDATWEALLAPYVDSPWCFSCPAAPMDAHYKLNPIGQGPSCPMHPENTRHW
jgi:hypothetical protein